MSAILHALSMLCALGTVVFASAAGRHGRAPVAAAAAFALAAWAYGPERLPDAGTIGLLAASGAFVILWIARNAPVAAAAAGALAGVWAALLRAQGVPAVAALPAAALVIGVSIWLTRTHPGFAPEAIRDEALLVVAAAGIGVVALPGILEGWQTAAALNLGAARSDDLAVPAWTLALVAAATATGAWSAVRSRR